MSKVITGVFSSCLEEFHIASYLMQIKTQNHKTIKLWLHVNDPRLIPLLESLALAAGLASNEQRIESVCHARALIERFCAHPLRAEIEYANAVESLLGCCHN